MAKVTITLEDDGDTVDMRIDFDPPAKKDDDLTNAQNAAFTALEAITGSAESSEEIEIDE